MCGGVGYAVKKINEEELRKYYSQELIDRFKSSGKVESFFWHKNASLPIQTKNGVRLKMWGNKDEEIKLPRTGWARDESLKLGKWNYLSPEPVDILVDTGYEKKACFNTPSGLQGILVKKGDEERVYMLTEEASEEYQKETGHNREPLGEKRDYK
jgi:hypothetical protein